MKNNYKLQFLVLAFLLASIHTACSQSLKPGVFPNVDPSLDERGNAYMNRQSQAFLNEVRTTLANYPPQLPEPRERYLGLLLLDAVMHDVYAAYRAPVQEFFHQQIDQAVSQIEKTKVKHGAVIWKLYNMGFVVKTKSTTFAFDLISGKNTKSESFAIPLSIMQRLIDQCDALFISHLHPDHADEEVANLFISNSKPVVAPPQVWNGKPIHTSITHLQRNADTIHNLMVNRNKTQLKVVLFPGHQMEKIENNVTLVITPEGLSFCQMGDQINEGNFMIDYKWIDKVANQYKVDVLMPPCWTNEIYRIVKGFNPQLVLPGHENEISHRLDDRVPFWGDSQFLELTYPELKKSKYKVLPMAWGESFHYLP